MTTAGLQGNYYIYPTATAIHRAWRMCDRKMREYQLLRRHALKLAYWPTGHDDREADADLDWDWIRSLESKQIGELRIDEPINRHRNVRGIFFKANHPLPEETINRIWLLTTFPKKRDGFSNVELRAFTGMRNLIVQRHYDGSPLA